MGVLVDMGVSPQAWVMPLPCSLLIWGSPEETRGAEALVDVLLSSGLVLQSGWASGGGGSWVAPLSAVPWGLVTVPGGQLERGVQRAQELVADVVQNMPDRHSQTREEFHVHGVFSTRSPEQVTQAVQRPSLSR